MRWFLYKTSSHAFCCVSSVPRHSSQGTITLGQCSPTFTCFSQHCENHRCRAAQTTRAEAEVTGATSIVANIACGRRRVHGIHCPRYLVRIFFSRASRLRLRGSKPSKSNFFLQHIPFYTRKFRIFCLGTGRFTLTRSCFHCGFAADYLQSSSPIRDQCSINTGLIILTGFDVLSAVGCARRFGWSFLSPSRGTEHRVSLCAYDTRVDGLPIFRIVRECSRTKIRAELSSNGSDCGVRGSLRTKSELSCHQMAHPGQLRTKKFELRAHQMAPAG